MSNIKIADMDLSVNENSFAYKKANELGLKGTGFGYFINEDGKIIAVSTEVGNRLVILEAGKVKLQKAPPTPAGTKRFYYAAHDGETHIVTAKHAKSKGWSPAKASQVRKHQATSSGAKTQGAMNKAMNKKTVSGRRPAKKTKVTSKNPANSPEVVDTANKILNLTKEIPPSALKNKAKKEKYIKRMIDAILQSGKPMTGAGRFRMSKEDLQVYSNYLDGKKPKVPKYNISDDDVNKVIDVIKQEYGTKGYQKFITKMSHKGTPPPKLANVARGRAVIKDYIMKGGISAISGKFVPFSDSQLDHRVSLGNGGYDGGGNWDWMEARYNQFKLDFEDDVLRKKIADKLSKSDEENKLDIMKQEYSKMAKSSYSNYFKNHGFDSLTYEDIANASGPEGLMLLKAVSDVGNISRYASAPTRASGRAGGGKFIGVPALKKSIISKLKPSKEKDLKKIDKGLKKVIDKISKTGDKIKNLSKTVIQQRAAKKKTGKV